MPHAARCSPRSAGSATTVMLIAAVVLSGCGSAKKPCTDADIARRDEIVDSMGWINDQMAVILENNPTCPSCDPNWAALQDLFTDLETEFAEVQDRCSGGGSTSSSSASYTAGAAGYPPSTIASGTPTTGIAY